MSISRRHFIQFMLANSVCFVPCSLSASQSAQKEYPIGFYEEPFTILMNAPQKDGYLGYIDASSLYTIDTVATSSIEILPYSMGAEYLWFTQDKNGQYITPIMEVKRGSVLRLTFPNTILHRPISPYITGLIFEENRVGFLYSPYANRSMYRIQCSVKNPSTTCIYSSMKVGTSGYYNHQGLSGLLYIHDEKEAMVDAHYQLEQGSTDIPLLFQDRRLDEKGRALYELTENDERGGYLGNTLLVNGGIYPQYTIAERIYKFRLVNMSNARILCLGLRTDEEELPFYIMNTGRGVLERSIHATRIFLAPCERIEVLVDARGLYNKDIYMMNYPFQALRATEGYTPNQYTAIEEKGCYCLVLLCRERYEGRLPSIPAYREGVEKEIATVQRKRTFTIVPPSLIEGNWKLVTESNVPGEVLLEGENVEEWEFYNPKESIPQVIYIPYFVNYIIERRGSPAHIAALSCTQKGLLPTDFGIKDSFTIWPNEKVKLCVTLPKTKGDEIVVTIHSKILESFDKGMLLLTRVL